MREHNMRFDIIKPMTSVAAHSVTSSAHEIWHERERYERNKAQRMHWKSFLLIPRQRIFLYSLTS